MVFQTMTSILCIFRASPTEFVIPFAKYQKAVYGNQLSLGMRFRMMFETEELGTRRYFIAHFDFLFQVIGYTYFFCILFLKKTIHVDLAIYYTVSLVVC